MSTNLYRALRALLPEPPLQIATIIEIHATDGTSTITWPGGGTQRVRGTGVAIGSNAFVRGGVVEGAAPNLTLETIEV